MQLVTVGVLTKMQHCSGAGPFTLVETLFLPILTFYLAFLKKTELVSLLLLFVCYFIFWFYIYSVNKFCHITKKIYIVV